MSHNIQIRKDSVLQLRVNKPGTKTDMKPKTKLPSTSSDKDMEQTLITDIQFICQHAGNQTQRMTLLST